VHQWIPVARPRLPTAENVFTLLREMDSRQVYSNRGPLVAELENLVASHVNVDPNRVVACASATVGIFGAAAISPVEEFVAPSYTFPASILALKHARKRTVLADISPVTWQVDAPVLENQGRLRVIPFGGPICLETGEFAAPWVIIDAAASLGSAHRDLSQLPGNACVIFSLHATKVLGIGEGGAVVFGSIEASERFRSWISFGFQGSRDSDLVGFNGKMSEISAAYGIAAFRGWDREQAEWVKAHSLARMVDDALGIGSIVGEYPGVNPYWIVLLESEEQVKQIERNFSSQGIGTRRWWEGGCHRMPAFQDCHWSSLRQTDAIASLSLGLPMFRGMGMAEVERIGMALEGILPGNG